jgi:protease IV
VMGNFEDRELNEVDALPAGTTDRDVREYRATIGVELALGGAGILASTTGVRDPSGADHSLGGTVVARLSAVGPASLIPPRDHLERIELGSDIDVRELTQIVLRLRRIARDDTVKGVLVQFDGADAGWAGLQELRGELLAVRKAGKKVFAYMLSGSSRDYFVASAADKIYLDPAGSLRLVGMAGQAFYFRGVFDELGILPQFEKIAEYKSAPEELTEFGPTPIASKMHADLFDSLFDQWIAAVADGRHLSIDAVKALVDNGPYDAGELADNTKLVDAVAAPDKVAELIAKEVGSIGIDSFSEVRPDRWKRPKVAIIYVDGDITDGESKSVPVVGQTLAGGETLVSSLAAVRADSSIGAVILRIDSPGGSAVASELIAREVFALRKVKPILCSMSNVAASGGYFVAAGCDAIFAEPMTITGSIGIFSGKFDLSGLAKKLGVGIDTYKHGKNSDTESMFRPFTDEERAELLAKLRYMYGRFVGAVAEGRGMSKDAVDAVGRGHVYTGVQAEPIKLVDRFGGLGDTLDEAKRRMGLPNDIVIDVVELPKRPGSLFGVVGKLLGVHEQASVSLVDLPIFKELLHSVPASVLVAPDVPQARLPYDIRFAK